MIWLSSASGGREIARTSDIRKRYAELLLDGVLARLHALQAGLTLRCGRATAADVEFHALGVINALDQAVFAGPLAPKSKAPTSTADPLMKAH